MSSPFPGFDPFLEAQGYWKEFHNVFLSEALYVLGGRVPGSYEVRVEERLSLVHEPDSRYRAVEPDISIHKTPRPSRPGSASSATATLEPVLVTLPSRRVEEVVERRLEIRRFPDRELVTAIELLSPSNKQAPGYDLYDEKRHELIQQKIHLVELDLLIGGGRLRMKGELPQGHYYVLVSRAERRFLSETYAWTIRDPLPLIPIPLKAPDPDILLDLSSIFAAVYERAWLGRSIDYAAPLRLPLSKKDRAWAEALARAGASPNGR
jgi:hypothetical protein